MADTEINYRDLAAGWQQVARRAQDDAASAQAGRVAEQRARLEAEKRLEAMTERLAELEEKGAGKPAGKKGEAANATH